MPELKKTGTVIIGGGIQGTSLAARLAHEGDVQGYRIVDPRPLLSEWLHGTEAQGLEVLRTSYASHIDPSDDDEALLELEYNERNNATGCGGHVRSRASVHSDQLTQPARVSTFNRHATGLISRFNLERNRVAGWAMNIRHVDGQFMTRIGTKNGPVDYLSERVVVAVGLGKPWMPDGGPSHYRVMHSHQVDVNGKNYHGKNICVVGGSLTGATLATHFARRGANVSLCARGRVTVSQLEAHPDWRPNEVLHNQFSQMGNMKERVRQLEAARVGTGITPAVWGTLTELVDSDQIVLHENAETDCWQISPEGKVALPHVDKDVDALIFATGYKISVNELPFMRSLLPGIEATDGRPHIDYDMESKDFPGLYFMGRLAELGAGPLSRNIPGAQYGSRQIAANIY